GDGEDEENDGDTNSDDEHFVDEWVDEIIDTVSDGSNSSQSDSAHGTTTEPPGPKSTTHPQTATPTPSPTPTPSETRTVTESLEPAAFDISNPTVADSSLAPGETLRVVVQVENGGEQAGTFDGQLRVDGEPVDTASATIDRGGMEDVAFEHRFEDPGEYELTVDRMDVGTVTVTKPTMERGETTRGGTADTAGRLVQVVDAEVPADWVRVGARTTLRATVVNTANGTVDRTLTVTIDGEVVGTETVALEPYERRVVSIEFVASDGDVSVDGFDVGTVDVRGHDTDPASGPVGSTAESGADTNRDSVGLLAVLGLLLGGAGLLVVARR
ncbi:MAG: CARDB domain-containing protein, partial [Halobacteriota archaeon]